MLPCVPKRAQRHMSWLHHLGPQTSVGKAKCPVQTVHANSFCTRHFMCCQGLSVIHDSTQA